MKAALERSIDDGLGEELEELAGVGIGQAGQAGAGLIYAEAGLVAGMVDRAGGFEGGGEFFRVGSSPGMGQADEQLHGGGSLFGGGFDEVMDDRKGEFPGLGVLADGFTNDAFAAGEVEQVVLNLEGRPEGDAEGFEIVAEFGVGAGGQSSESTGGTNKGTGLSADYLLVGRFVD